MSHGVSTTASRLLTVSEAATMLGIKRSTLYQWAYLGRIDKVKLFGPRGALRFRLSDIEKLIDASVHPARRSAFDGA